MTSIELAVRDMLSRYTLEYILELNDVTQEAALEALYEAGLINLEWEDDETED